MPTLNDVWFYASVDSTASGQPMALKVKQEYISGHWMPRVPCRESYTVLRRYSSQWSLWWHFTQKIFVVAKSVTITCSNQQNNNRPKDTQGGKCLKPNILKHLEGKISFAAIYMCSLQKSRSCLNWATNSKVNHSISELMVFQDAPVAQFLLVLAVHLVGRKCCHFAILKLWDLGDFLNEDDRLLLTSLEQFFHSVLFKVDVVKQWVQHCTSLFSFW